MTTTEVEEQALPPFEDPEFDALQWDKTHRGEMMNLKGYVETWKDDFLLNEIGTIYAEKGKWFAPVHAPFGDAKFVGPTAQPAAYIVANGQLRIRMQTVNGVWQSGIIQNLNNKTPPSYGFTQECGVFEARMKFPRAAGVWPAFWMLSPNAHRPRLEIDVIEAYGPDWDGYHSAIHLGGKYHKSNSPQLTGKAWLPANKQDLFDFQFHTYTCMIEEALGVRIYYDGYEIGRFPWSEYFRTPIYMLVDLALQLKNGVPSSPQNLHVEYVRAMKKVV